MRRSWCNVLVVAVIVACETARTSSTSTGGGSGGVARDTGWPNQPPGFTKVTERPFSTLLEDGWLMGADLMFSIQNDPSAPKSPPGVGQALFPLGFVGGVAPITTARNLEGAYRAIYVSFWIKFSPNWVGHPSGVNKIFHIWINGSNRVYVQAHGSGSNQLLSVVSTQGANEPNRDLDGNVSQGVITRGAWQRWELVLSANTDGLPNGAVYWWIDGVEAGRYTDLNFVGQGARNVWDVVDWNPTWGGIGAVLLADQTMAIDHIYVSGLP